MTLYEWESSMHWSTKLLLALWLSCSVAIVISHMYQFCMEVHVHSAFHLDAKLTVGSVMVGYNTLQDERGIVHFEANPYDVQFGMGDLFSRGPSGIYRTDLGTGELVMLSIELWQVMIGLGIVWVGLWVIRHRKARRVMSRSTHAPA